MDDNTRSVAKHRRRPTKSLDVIISKGFNEKVTNDQYVSCTSFSGCIVTHGMDGVKTRCVELGGAWSTLGRSPPGERSLAQN